MNEQYVTYGVAKLLKEKGFDWEVRSLYGKYEDDIGFSSWSNNYNTYDDLYSAPTQQMACRWLREVHKIDISVTSDDGSWWIKVTELESWSGVFNGKVLNSDDIKYAYKGDISTKESCYEAALEYALSKLI